MSGRLYRNQNLARLFETFLVGFLSAAVLLPSETQARANRCEDLFVPFRIPKTEAEISALASPVRIDQKTQDPKLVERLIEAIDGDVRGQIRVWVDIREGLDTRSEAVINRLEALENRGLRVAYVNERRVVLQGHADVVLSAVRSPEVESIWNLDSGNQRRHRWPHFSKIAPAIHQSYWQSSLEQKFEWPDFYKSVRSKILGPPGLQFRSLIKIQGLIPGSTDFGRFSADAKSLGLSVETEISKADQQKSDGLLLIMQGPIDPIYSVLRHPAVVKVVRVEEYFSEAQLLERRQIEIEFRDKLKSDYLNLREIPRRISLAGEKTSEPTIEAFRDEETPSLIRLEPIKNLRSIIAHEARTAVDYSKFVRNHFRQDFAFLAEYQGKSVPVFDGLVLNQHTHAVLANVSLKYNATVVDVTKMDRATAMAHLIEAISDRFSEFRRKKPLLTQPEEWFRVVNNLPSDALSRAGLDYEANIRSSQTLSSLFGLFTPGDKGAHETRIVVDVRDYGFSFEFFKDPEVQAGLRDLFVESANRYHVSLTLLWNDRQGVVIRRNGVRLYQ